MIHGLETGKDKFYRVGSQLLFNLCTFIAGKYILELLALEDKLAFQEIISNLEIIKNVKR